MHLIKFVGHSFVHRMKEFYESEMCLTMHVKRADNNSDFFYNVVLTGIKF